MSPTYPCHLHHACILPFPSFRVEVRMGITMSVRVKVRLSVKMVYIYSRKNTKMATIEAGD